MITPEKMKDKAKYSTLDIVKALGIPRERLRDWMSRGFIEPTLPARGQGTKSGFTLADVYGVALFGKLIQVGLKRDMASKVVKEIVKYGDLLRGLPYIVVKIEALESGNHIRVNSAFGGQMLALRLEVTEDMTMTQPLKADLTPAWVDGENVGKMEDEGSWDLIFVVNFIRVLDEVNEAFEEWG